MTPERFDQIEALFHSALACSGKEREALLDQLVATPRVGDAKHLRQAVACEADTSVVRQALLGEQQHEADVQVLLERAGQAEAFGAAHSPRLLKDLAIRRRTAPPRRSGPRRTARSPCRRGTHRSYWPCAWPWPRTAGGRFSRNHRQEAAQRAQRNPAHQQIIETHRLGFCRGHFRLGQIHPRCDCRRIW